MSEVKVNKISPRSGTTITLGDSGDTFTVPSGVTFDASSGGLAGTLTTAAQPNITSVGTLTSFTSTGIDDNATSTAITIDSNENVGIGTSSPSNPLHLSSTSYPQFAIQNSTSTYRMGVDSNQKLIFDPISGSTRNIVFQNSGAGEINVGIGTSSPDLIGFGSGTNGLEIADATIAGLRLNGNNSDSFFLVSGAGQHWVYGKGSVPLSFSTNGTEAMRIDSSGNVGIGTSSPGHKLEVSGNAKANNFTNRTSLQGIDATPDDVNRFELGGGYLNLYRDDTAEVNQIQFGKNGTLAAAFSTGADYLAIKTNGDNERMRITSTGNAGIGTTSPSFKFEVDAGSDSGMGKFISSIDGGTTNLYVGNSFNTSGSTDEKTRVTFLLGNGSSAIGAYKENDTTTGANRDCGIEIYTQENNSEQVRFRIDHVGNITATDTSIGSLSDERLKKDITDFTYNLDTFKSLKPRTFNWKNAWLHGNETNRRGFIAQELETVDSYWVSKQKVSKKPDDILEEATYYEVGDEIPEGKKIGDIKTEATYSYKYKKGDGSDNDLLNDGTDLDNIEMIAKLGKKDAMYVSVIQQLITKIESLEARITTLENA